MNPMENLGTLIINGKRYQWTMNLTMSWGFIGLNDLQQDYNIISTEVNTFDAITKSALISQEYIKNNIEQFEEYCKKLDVLLDKYKKTKERSDFKAFQTVAEEMQKEFIKEQNGYFTNFK